MVEAVDILDQEVTHDRAIPDITRTTLPRTIISMLTVLIRTLQHTRILTIVSLPSVPQDHSTLTIGHQITSMLADIIPLTSCWYTIMAMDITFIMVATGIMSIQLIKRNLIKAIP